MLHGGLAQYCSDLLVSGSPLAVAFVQRNAAGRRLMATHFAKSDPAARVVHLRDPAPTPQAKPRRRVILVLGMSRSGTSLMTRLCSLAGAALPDGLMQPDFGNPLGHWEPSRLVALNEEILAALDLAWNDPRPVQEAWFRSREAYAFQTRLRAALEQCCGPAPLSVLKDPRIAKLLPLYLDAFDTLNIEPLILMQVRPPLEVIESLVHRDGLDPFDAELLWVRAVAEAEFHSRGCRRFWVEARSVIDDWQGALERIGHAFQLRWPNSAEQMSGEAGQYLKPRLLHRASPAPNRSPSLGLIANLAWCAITDSLQDNAALAMEKFDALHGLMADVDRLHRGYIAALASDRRRLRDVLSSRSWRVTAPLRLVGRLVGGP